LENVGIFYGHLEYFNAIWDILWPLGTFIVDSVIFELIWYIFPFLVLYTM
jgi:hypothetical protein